MVSPSKRTLTTKGAEEFELFIRGEWGFGLFNGEWGWVAFGLAILVIRTGKPLETLVLGGSGKLISSREMRTLISALNLFTILKNPIAYKAFQSSKQLRVIENV